MESHSAYTHTLAHPHTLSHTRTRAHIIFEINRALEMFASPPCAGKQNAARSPRTQTKTTHPLPISYTQYCGVYNFPGFRRQRRPNDDDDEQSFELISKSHLYFHSRTQHKYTRAHFGF